MATGQQIRKHRDAQGLTLEQLGEKSGVDFGTIHALEKRDSSRSKFFGQIAHALGLTIEELSKEPHEIEKKLPDDAMKIARIYSKLSAARKAAVEQTIMGFLALDRAEEQAMRDEQHLQCK